MMKKTDLRIHILKTCPIQVRFLPSIAIKVAFAYQRFRMKMAADPSGAMINLDLEREWRLILPAP